MFLLLMSNPGSNGLVDILPYIRRLNLFFWMFSYLFGFWFGSDYSNIEIYEPLGYLKISVLSILV